MNSKQRIGLAVGGGIIAVAAAVGVGAFAANLAGGGGNQGSAPGYGQRQGGGYGNRGGQGQQFDTSALAKQLATKLGVDEAKMKTALDNAFKANQPSGGFTPGTRPSGMPSGGMPSGAMPSGARPSGGFGGNGTRQTERLEAMAKSIATELNLDESKVLAALQEVMSTTGGGQGGAQPSAQPTS